MSVITLLVVNGCNEIESVFRGENLRTVQASFEDKTTRVSLVPAANSADMITKWQQDDRIHVILMNGTQYIDVGRVPVRDISENGKSCIFQYALPKELFFRKELPKTLVGKVAYRLLEEEANQEL